MQCISFPVGAIIDDSFPCTILLLGSENWQFILQSTLSVTEETSPFWSPDSILVRFSLINFCIVHTLKDDLEMSYDTDLDSSIFE